MKGAGFFYLLTVPPEPSVHIFVFLTIKEIYDVIYHPQQVRIQPYSVHEEKREAHWTLYTVIPVFPHSFYRERRGFIFIGIAPEQAFFKCIFKCISAQSFYFSIHNIDMQCLRFFRQSRHTKNFSGNGYNHFSSVIDYNIFNMELEVVHRTINLRVGRE